jgi:AcrR family transcriptional regulator
MSEIGHREREKAKRRRSIELAALSLFAEKGFDETTIQEIAALASVSPRTVLMYFHSKSDIALASINADVLVLTERLKKDSKNKPVMEIFSQWFMALEGHTDQELRDVRSRAFKRNPTLIGSMSFEIQEAMEVASNALAKEYGIPKNHIGILLTINQISGLPSVLEQIGGSLEEIMEALRVALKYADAGLKAVKKI